MVKIPVVMHQKGNFGGNGLEKCLNSVEVKNVFDKIPPIQEYLLETFKTTKIFLVDEKYFEIINQFLKENGYWLVCRGKPPVAEVELSLVEEIE